MKKLGLLLSALILSGAMQAQETVTDKNIFNHMDLGVNIGTVGIGIEVAVPVSNYVRIRAGYNYMPRFSLHANFPIETRNGGIGKYLEKIKNVDIEKKAAEIGVDLNQPEFRQYKEMADKFSNVERKDNVTMNLKPNMHQFKFLVDVLPFVNKHWNFTAGFFVGNSDIGDAKNQDKETLLLEAVNAYNQLYINYCQHGIGDNIYYDKLDDIFYKNGIAGIPLGYFANGNKAMMVPDKDGTVRAEMKITKVRPYVGFGYNTHLSRNKKWNLHVDAGVLFLCGKPKVYVDNVYSIDPNAPAVLYDNSFGMPQNNFDIIHPNLDYDYISGDKSQQMFFVDQPLQHVDLMNDLHNIPGKVGDLVKTISNFKAYPNVSVTFSYRLY